MADRRSYILGISAFYHDSAAALLRDGEIVAAAQEERFTRIKHDRGFPRRAVEYCLSAAGIGVADIELAAYYDKPLLTFDRLLETYLAFAPAGFQSFRAAMPVWLHEKLHLPREIQAALGDKFQGELLFCLHHVSHAASAFYPSPFERAAVLTADGVGEWSTTSIGAGRGRELGLIREMRFPHSLGLLYSAFAYYLGFKVNSGEYKVMGLAPYGAPKYVDLILDNLIDVKEDGSFFMDMRFFNYCQGLTMTSEAFHELFGGPPRGPESRLTQRHMDLAASIQEATNRIVIRLARYARRETGEENLCMAGGVALNCVANGLVLREKIFKRIFIQPAAGDAGGALGAALFAHHQLLEKPRRAGPRDAMRGSFLGPAYPREDIQKALAESGVSATELSPDALLQLLCARLEAGDVIGLVRGRMEFGPRALGARSIIGDPRNPEMQSKMNLKIKFRESFRPFAPAVREEDCAEYFELETESPYMLLVAPVREKHRKAPAAGSQDVRGLDLLKLPRSEIPAVTHVDYSARVQTVSAQDNPFLHGLLAAFKARTGCGVLVNTSFNVRGEPIVCSPADAIRCFLNTDMDALVVENFVSLKSDQNAAADREQYLRRFAPD
ncbi:MAG: carbamoyltransferase [Elusimicrobia bacterium]|nr:carbamoyltransferase [Elusimicrobiota bacterium]